MLRCWLIVLAVLVAFAPGAGFADTTYSCTEVDRKANVGVPDRTTVTIAASDRTCNFSVSNATVTSSAGEPLYNGSSQYYYDGPPDHLYGYQLLQDAPQVDVFREDGRQILQQLLFGPTYGQDVPADLQNELERALSSERARACFQVGLFAPEEPFATDGYSFGCGVIRPSSEGASVELRTRIEIKSEQTLMVIALAGYEGVFFTFLPFP